MLNQRYKHEVQQRQKYTERKNALPTVLQETYKQRQIATVRVPSHLRAQSKAESAHNAEQQANATSQREGRSVFTQDPTAYMLEFEADLRDRRARGDPTAIMPREKNFLLQGLTLEGDERWAESLVLLDRLRRMQSAPKGGDGRSSPEKDGRRRRRKRGGGGDGSDGGGGGGAQSATGQGTTDDYSADYTNYTNDNGHSHSHSHSHMDPNASFGSLQMSPARPDDRHVSFGGGGGGGGGGAGRPPLHPGFADHMAELDPTPSSPLFGGLRNDDDDDDDNDDNDDDGGEGGSGNEVNKENTGARSGKKNHWDSNALFDALEMTREERAEAQKIYALRTQRDASVAFAVGGTMRTLNPAPLLTGSLGIPRIPVLHKKTASAGTLPYPSVPPHTRNTCMHTCARTHI